MEHKGRNKGGRPKKETAEKLSYRIGVKMAAADYFRLLTRAYEAGISPSEGMFPKRICARTVVERALRLCAPALRHGEQSQPACT